MKKQFLFYIKRLAKIAILFIVYLALLLFIKCAINFYAHGLTEFKINFEYKIF